MYPAVLHPISISLFFSNGVGAGEETKLSNYAVDANATDYI